MREMTLAQLTDFVSGQLAGDAKPGSATVSGTCPIDHYKPGKVAYVRDRKYSAPLGTLKGAVVMLPHHLSALAQESPQNTYILVDDVYDRMMDLQEYFYGSQEAFDQQGVASTAVIHDTAKLGKEVFVGDFVSIGRNVVIGDNVKALQSCSIMHDVTIGRNSILYPGVHIYPRCHIGEDCIIHAGACIGADGFRFQQEKEAGKVRKWLHAGRVVIGNRVEVGANSTIDRATFEDEATTLADDVKLDDQVHIGHNARIGARSLLAAQTCVSGSVNIGEDVWSGAGVTISQGVTIGNGATILLNAVVAYDVPEGERVSGFYAMPHSQWQRAYLKLRGER